MVGAIKSNAKGFPAKLKNLTFKRKVHFVQIGDIVYYAFHDRKVVRFISNVLLETMPNQVPWVQPEMARFNTKMSHPFCLHTTST